MKKKISKRMSELKNRVDLSVQYDIEDGLGLLKTVSSAKFIESVDVAIHLGIDAKKIDQNIKGSVVMPYGIGNSVRIAVFTQGDNIILAKNAGADLVGLEDVYDYIKKEGCKNIDVVIASPDVMHVVSKLGPILGPRGLMPNPKMGTVSQNIEESVKNIKSGGQVRYKNDKNGIIHSTIGKINFSINNLKGNLAALIKSLNKVKPIQVKVTYVKKVYISTTMGISILINKSSVDTLML